MVDASGMAQQVEWPGYSPHDMEYKFSLLQNARTGSGTHLASSSMSVRMFLAGSEAAEAWSRPLISILG